MPTPRQYATDADRQRAYRERSKQAVKDLAGSKGLPTLPALATMPGKARWTALQEQARAALETLRDELQAYHDDRSEQWQESDRAALYQDAIGQAENALSEVDSITLP